jgi:zinc-ribbon domain/Sel1 repeat
VRCPQCASENPTDYRFCGMCGTPLEQPVAEPVARSVKPEEPATVPADEILARVEKFKPKSRSNGGTSLLGLNDTLAPPSDRRVNETPGVRSDRAPFDLPPQPIERVEPPAKSVEWGAHRETPASTAISGPSFLGLGGEPPKGGYGETSRDLNYLFEEDEQPRRSYGRFIGILLVLAVLGGLGYLQYKRSGGSWTPPWAKGPAQTPIQASQQQPGDQTNVGENSGQATSANNAAPAGQAPAGQTPVAQSGDHLPNAQDRSSDSTVTEKDLPPQGTAAQGGQAATGPAAARAPGETAGTPESAASSEADKGDKAASKKEDTTETASAAPAPRAKGTTDTGKGAKDTESDAKKTASTSATKGGSAAKDNADENAADVPAKSAKPARTKPSPQVASPDDTLVTNAEKYLYGRGVPQNCDRALISLRAAANRQNSRAMTLLGTMYGTGHCVGRDLPNSYRWFAQASRQSPDNTWINRNLEMIWREMTPAERQLATARQ